MAIEGPPERVSEILRHGTPSSTEARVGLPWWSSGSDSALLLQGGMGSIPVWGSRILHAIRRERGQSVAILF